MIITALQIPIGPGYRHRRKNMEPSKTLDEFLKELYLKVDPALDQLPYTPEFEWMYQTFQQRSAEPWDRNRFFKRLTNLRKNGELPRKKQ